jgi:hypothetical protein
MSEPTGCPPSAAKIADEMIDRIELIAPANLPGGYELECEFEGRTWVVRVVRTSFDVEGEAFSLIVAVILALSCPHSHMRVLSIVCLSQPPEGVKEGQHFVAEVIRSDDDAGSAGHRIPTGEWRDGVCSLFVHGVCHPALCLAYWCYPLALGQILTRMGLNAVGNEIPRDRRAAQTSAFKVVASVYLLYYVTKRWLRSFVQNTNSSQVFQTPAFNYSSGESQYQSSHNHSYWFDDDIFDYSEVENANHLMWGASCARAILRFLFWTYMLALLIRVRAHVRQRYSIPERHCAGCEDCCCAFWLPCCTVLQIARHTADYATHRAVYCTETGLSHTAPQVV